MIVIRIEGEEIRLEPEEWTLWVEDGRIPPTALVSVDGGAWMRAAELESYQELRRREERPRGDRARVREVLFPSRGLSATEALIAINLLVAVVLLMRGGAGYLEEVRIWTDGWWHAVRGHRAYWWWVPTLFIHAGPDHLLGNMVSLVAGAGAVEFLMGRAATTAIYLAGGIGGAWLSYLGHDQPPLSIGASGAIFGLAGCTAAFLVRRRRLFSHRQQWKTRRVYLPLWVLFFLPSLLHADYWAHVGGLVTGLLVGAFVPPHPRVLGLLEGDDARQHGA